MDPLSGESDDESSNYDFNHFVGPDEIQLTFIHNPHLLELRAERREQGLMEQPVAEEDGQPAAEEQTELLTEEQTQPPAEELVCSISCCKFNRTNRQPICCPNPNCNTAICKQCFFEWFGKPCNEFVCLFCNNVMTLAALLERNPELPKKFIHELLKYLSQGAFLREQVRYQEELERLEKQKRSQDILAELKARKNDFKLNKYESDIFDLKKRLKELRCAAKDVHSCPIPECTGTCFNGKCQDCNISVCMNCICQKTGNKDPIHGKKEGKCSILEGCGDEPKRVNPRVAEFLLQIRKIEEKIANYQKVTDEYNKIQNELTEELRRLNGGEGSSSTKKKYGPRCPMPECNGYVEIQNWKCSSCEVRVCAQCHVVRQEDHECNPDTVATIKLMEKDTKECPRCKIPIHKISGCSQMYCTHCEALWDWNTEKVLDPNVFIHNPHLLELRAERREQGLVEQPVAEEDIHCHDPVDDRQMRIRFEQDSTQTPKNIKFKSLVMPEYVINDTQNLMRNNLQYQTQQTQRRNKLMFKYFNNNIAEEEWKKELKSILKLEERNKELIPVFQNYIECLHILAWRYILGELTTPEYLEHYQALKNLTMQRFSVIKSIFGLRVPVIGEYGQFI